PLTLPTHDLLPLRRRIRSENGNFVIRHSSDHIHIQHRLRTNLLRLKKIDETRAADDAAFLGGERHEEVASWSLSRLERSGGLDQRRHPGSVIVRARMGHAGISRLKRIFAASAEVIEVRSDHDGATASTGLFASEESDDVIRANLPMLEGDLSR